MDQFVSNRAHPGWRVAIACLLVLAFSALFAGNWYQADAQTPPNDDFLPKNVAISHDTSSLFITLTVNWDAPTAKWNDGAGLYWVRYRLAGTTDYVEYNWDPGSLTSITLPSCESATGSASAATYGYICDINFAKGRTFIIEVAQRTSGANPVTVPTGTDADWVKLYHSIPYDPIPRDGTNNDQRLSFFNRYLSTEPARETGSNTTFQFKFDVLLRPDSQASIEALWHDNWNSDQIKATPDDFTIIDNIADDWTHTTNNNYRAIVSFRAVDDGIVEPEIEIIYFRGFNDKGRIERCCGSTSIQLIDTDSTEPSVVISPSSIETSGVAEQSTDVEVVASLTSPLDSRCELGWTLDLASDTAESVEKLSADDFVGAVERTGTFVFEEGDTEDSHTFTLANDGVPEGAESSDLTFGDLDCENDYTRTAPQTPGEETGIIEVDLDTSLQVAANDLPVISTVTAGDGGQNANQSATVDWGIGDADAAMISGFQVRWTPEVAGEDDAFYLTDSGVVWSTEDVGLASARSQVFPTTGRLDGGTSYVVQVGAVTTAGADPIFSEVVERVTTDVDPAPPPTNPPTSPPTNPPTSPPTVPPSTDSTSPPTTGSTVAQVPTTETTASTAPPATETTATTVTETTATISPPATTATTATTASETTATTATTVTETTATTVTETTATSPTVISPTATSQTPTSQTPATGTPTTEQITSQPSSPTSNTSPGQTASTQAPSGQVPDTSSPNTQPSQPSTPPGTRAPVIPPSGGDGSGPTINTNFNISNNQGTVIIVQENTQIGFIDTVGTTHEANIDRLAEGGITRGCNPPANSLFCPGRAVTRGEMATFMVRAFDLPTSESNLFADDDGNTHESNINALAVAEITRGCNPPENSRYCPDRPVTRAQMATFLARAMELAEGSGEFDDTTSSPHANDINRIASVGITRGCNPPDNSRFCPDRAVTRGEMATFLIRAEDRSES